jgi:hypothetical protein
VFRIGLYWVACLLTMLLLVSCARSSASPFAGSEQTATYTDPFAYCAAVGTIDTPDGRYVGAKVDPAIAVGLRKAFGLPTTAPLAPFMRNTFWRCMKGKVFACTIGANLPCQEKANTSQTPTQGMVDFCKTKPNADVIPAYVTGRATVYLWRCKEGVPQVVKQLTKPDGRGFLANIWYQIEPEQKG